MNSLRTFAVWAALIACCLLIWWALVTIIAGVDLARAATIAVQVALWACIAGGVTLAVQYERSRR